MATSMMCLRGASKGMILGLQRTAPFSTGSIRLGVSGQEVHPRYKKVWAQYEHFQLRDGVPVHFKKGFRDKLLFTLTCVGLAFGLAWSGVYAYSLIYPPKKE